MKYLYLHTNKKINVEQFNDFNFGLNDIFKNKEEYYVIEHSIIIKKVISIYNNIYIYKKSTKNGINTYTRINIYSEGV